MATKEELRDQTGLCKYCNKREVEFFCNECWEGICKRCSEGEIFDFCLGECSRKYPKLLDIEQIANYSIKN